MGKGKNKKKSQVEPVEEPSLESACVQPDVEGGDIDAKAVELEDRLLRLQADFDNFRKRVARERGEIYTRANEDLLMEIIPVLDHMDMALDSAAAHDAPKALLDGINLVTEQLKGVLAKFGLEKIDASGKSFDPNEHEAIAHLPSGEVVDNMVMDQTRLGYKLKGRILRPAQVVVSSGTSSDNNPADEPEVKG